MILMLLLLLLKPFQEIHSWKSKTIQLQLTKAETHLQILLKILIEKFNIRAKNTKQERLKTPLKTINKSKLKKRWLNLCLISVLISTKELKWYKITLLKVVPNWLFIYVAISWKKFKLLIRKFQKWSLKWINKTSEHHHK